MADVKRLNYFTSQFLVEKDFTDEQEYLMKMRRRHNQLLHTWGVADGGLQVTKSADKVIGIGSGMAIDKDGRELVLLDAQSKDLTTFGSNADVYITATYEEVFDPGDHYTVGGIDNYTRTTERPLVEAGTTVPVNDGSVIVLAKVKLDGGGNIGTVDSTVRKIAGSAIDPTVNLAVNSLSVTGNATVGGNVGIGTTAPKAKLQVAGGAIMPENGNTAAAGILFPSDPGGGTGDKAWMRYYARTGEDTTLEIGTSDGPQDHICLMPSGNVGIGTTDPAAKLTIQTPEPYNGNMLKVESKQEPDKYYLNFHADTSPSVVKWVFDQTNAGANFPSILAFDRGNVGIGTEAPTAKLQVVGGAIMPQSGTGGAAGILFSSNPTVASGEAAWMHYYKRSAQGTTLEIGTSLDPQDHISLMPSGNVGIGTVAPIKPLHIVRNPAVPNAIVIQGIFANDEDARKVLNGLPADSLIVGGPWGNLLYFYWKDHGGAQYRVLLSGTAF